jgi:hypothetical protein
MINPELKSPIDRPLETSLSAAHIIVINQLLNNLRRQCPAELILLAEDNGYMLSVLTDRKVPGQSTLGSLVTGSLATSTEIARNIGLNLNDQMILREGIKSITCTTTVGTSLVLYILINKEIPLGWVRQMVHDTVCRLAELITDPSIGGQEPISLSGKMNFPSRGTNDGVAS